MSIFKNIAGGVGRKLMSFGAGGGGGIGGAFGGGHEGGVGFGYDAVMPKGQRKIPGARVLSEDMELPDLARRQLSTNNRDLQRNFELCAWAIRQHLNYTTSFTFESRNGDDGLDKDIDAFMEHWSLPENCDAGGRHSLSQLTRLWESRAVVDGDIVVNALAWGSVQSIEGDRVMSFGGIPYADLGIQMENVVNGVHVDPASYRTKGYCVFKRRPLWAGLEWDRYIPARFARLHGFYDRIDQVRGISPLSSACNRYRDIYENFDYALLKAKVSQFLAVVFQRQEADSIGIVEPQNEQDHAEGFGAEGDGEIAPGGLYRSPNVADARYKFKFGHGPLALDIEPGDKPPSILESATPSTQFQSFTQQMMIVALLALDIPFCFLDSAHANYSGTRMAAIQYEKSVAIRRHAIVQLLNWLTRWRLGLAILDGDIKLPSKMSPGSLRFDWMHSGTAWYDPLKEVSGAVAEVNAGFNSARRICRDRGLNFKRIIDERAEDEAYAKSKNVLLSTALAAAALDDPAKQQTLNEQQNEVQEDKDAKAASTARWSF